MLYALQLHQKVMEEKQFTGQADRCEETFGLIQNNFGQMTRNRKIFMAKP